jgi:hypothetical protein
MHPPFYVVDHRIDHDPLPTEEHKVIRRNQPSRLALNLPAPGMPVVIFAAVSPPAPVAPGLFARLLHRLRARRLRPAPGR